jgi:hypothetical protein
MVYPNAPERPEHTRLVERKMSATNYVSTWMYVESAQEGGLYPQVGGLTTSQSTQNIYWRCVYTFFWSANVFLKKDGLKLRLFTNVVRLPVVDGIDLNKALADFGVELVTLRYTWAPAGTRRPWFNQYFLFDILDYAATRLADDDVLFVMDNDCLIVGDLTPAFELARRDGAALITVDVSEDEDANGLSRRQAIDVYAAAGGERPAKAPDYFGGEFYGVSGAMLKRLLPLAKEVRVKNDALAAAGKAYFSDEAHFFSYLVWRLGLRAANANYTARRIWTTWKLNNTDAADLTRPVWHLPSEKTYGFADLFARLAAGGGFSGDPAQIRTKLARLMGVGHKSARKFLGHFVRAARRRLRR